MYFALEESPSIEKLQELAKLAWESGIQSIQPYYGHRNSDITVIVLCSDADKSIMKACKKIKYK